MLRVRLLSSLPGLVLFVLAFATGQAADVEDTTAADEKLLRERGIASDGPGLLGFLRERSLSEEERAQMAQLVQQLGDNEFEKREAASRTFVLRGPVSIPFLKTALHDPDAEVVRRARSCLEDLHGGPGPSLPIAAIRQLVRKQPSGAVEMLLRYVPFADDESVEDECLTALRALGLREGKAVNAVVAALHEKEPLRRAAAAYTVAAAKDKEQREQAVRLLRDEAPLVRFRTVQGLLAVRDPQGVPVLIDFLREGPPEITWRAEDILLRLAGDKGPLISLTTEDERKKAWAAWAAWWKENQRTVDLAKLDEAPPFFNWTLVCEMHGGKIWEVDQAGKVRWTMDKLNCPRDAQILPGGRILITEVNDNKIREREIATGKVLWEHAITDPSFVRRLPNGNTFIANHEFCYEITPDGKKIFDYKPPEQGFLIHSIDRRPNGNVVCLSMSGILREVDREGKTVRQFNVTNNGGGNWCGVQALPGNRYLCVEFNQSEIFEYDTDGKVQWRCKVLGASYALRLPNGRTMICCFGGQRVVQVDRDGKIVWETKVGTQPWRARVR